MTGASTSAGEPPNPSWAQAQVIVDELARCGLQHAVLAPGSRSAALAMVVQCDPRVTLHVEIDERSAGFLALGIAKASGVPALVVTSSGTAAANLYPAVIEADAAAVPLIAVTADRPPELRATGANQTIDQVKLFGDRVRWFTEIAVAEDRPGVVAYWRSSASRLWAESVGSHGDGGPVHANIPTREPTVPATDDGRSVAQPFGQPLDGRPAGRPWTSVRRVQGTVPEDEVRDLAGRIATTERGLIVVGDAHGDLATVADLARAAGWPVVAEPMAGLRGCDNVMSSGDLLLDHPGFAWRHRPDLVLRIGRQGVSAAVARLLADAMPQVLVDPGGRWLDPDRTVSQILVADPSLTAHALMRHLPAAASSDWLAAWQQADTKVRARIDQLLDGQREMTEPRVARDVTAAVPTGGTLVVSSSMPIRDVDRFMAPRRGLRVLANRGASGIDGVVSTMLGVALGSSAGPVVGLIGDLALLHDSAGFNLRAGADQVDLTLVVVNNDGGGIFSFLPQAAFPEHFERVFGTPHGRDMARLAAFHSVPYTRADDPGALSGIVRANVAGGGLRMIEVRTDRRRNVEMHRRLRTAAHDVLED